MDDSAARSHVERDLARRDGLVLKSILPPPSSPSLFPSHPHPLDPWSYARVCTVTLLSVHSHYPPDTLNGHPSHPLEAGT